MPHTHQEIRHLQERINSFNQRFKLGRQKLREDGRPGPLTRRYLRQAKYELGYPKAHRGARWGDQLLWRLDHARTSGGPYDVPKRDLRRGRRHRVARRAWVRRNRVHAVLTPGVATFDGRPTAKWIIPYCRWAREIGHNGIKWDGQVVSGWRSKAYSEHLCKVMCGQPTCPGRCAGRFTRHVGNRPHEGAIDVSDYETFRMLMAHCPINPHLTNHLPNDPVHFSVAGN